MQYTQTKSYLVPQIADFTCRIYNNTSAAIMLGTISLPWGTWKHEPPTIIGANENNYFEAVGTNLTATEGFVTYLMLDASFKVFWIVSADGGKIDQNLDRYDPKELYTIELTQAPARMVLNISEKKTS